LRSENIVANKWDRKRGYGASSESLRAHGMLGGWYMGWAFPLTGVGAGQAPHFFDYFSGVVRDRVIRDSSFLAFLPERIRDPFIARTRWSSAESGISSIFLVAWGETGLLGLLALVGLLATVIVKGSVAIWTARPFDERTAVLFLVPVLIALILMHQMVLIFVHPWIWSMIALAYAAAEFGGQRQTMIDARRDILP